MITSVVLFLVSSLIWVGMGRAQGTALDLSGRWYDNGREVIVRHEGSEVVAEYVEPFPLCDPQDGSEPQPYEKDFEATLSGDSLSGKVTVCNWGEDWGSEIGIQEVDMRLGVSADGNTLSGAYEIYTGPVEMTLTRLPDCAELEALKEELKKWLAIAGEQSQVSDQMYQEAVQAYGEGTDLLEQQIGEELWSQLPLPVMVYTASGPEDAPDIAITTAEELADNVGDLPAPIAGAAKKAGWIDFVVDWTFMIAGQLTKLAEGNRYGESASEIGDQAFQSLQRARRIQEQIEALEEECPGDEESPVTTAQLESQSDGLQRYAESLARVNEHARAAQEAWTEARERAEQASAVVSGSPSGAEFSAGEWEDFRDALLDALRRAATALRAHEALRYELDATEPPTPGPPVG